LVDLLENCNLTDDVKSSCIIFIQDTSSPIGGEDAGNDAVNLLKEMKCGIKNFDDVMKETNALTTQPQDKSNHTTTSTYLDLLEASKTKQNADKRNKKLTKN
jgi:hypothetical protein